MSKKIDVLVVDDSAYMRKVITNMLQSDEEIFVVDTARDGLDALEKIKQWKPQVVTLDVEMPRMDGLTALQKIMQECPTAVVMLSSLTQEGNATTIKALSLGAVDFVPKPSGAISLDIAKVKEDLIAKIKVAARASLKNVRSVAQLAPEKLARPLAGAPGGGIPDKLVVIGSSTGGPNALQQVVPRLPGNLPAGVLIIQHMPAGFTNSLAHRLNDISSLAVKEAAEGDIVQRGHVYIAPGGQHMVLDSRLTVRLNTNPPVHSVRPAVDVTMESVVENFKGKLIGVILTGMGYDGAKGMAAIKRIGGKTIAQNEATCVVYGMPRVVVESGKADKVLPITEIAQGIVEML